MSDQSKRSEVASEDEERVWRLRYERAVNALRFVERALLSNELTHVDIALDTIRDALRELPAESAPSELPTIAVALEGGIVQGGWSDTAVNLLVIDYDDESAEEEELRDIPQFDRDGRYTETADAILYDVSLVTLPKVAIEKLSALLRS